MLQCARLHRLVSLLWFVQTVCVCVQYVRMYERARAAAGSRLDGSGCVD